MDAEEFACRALPLHERLARAVMATRGDRSLAEEAAQEALTRAWERVDGGEPLTSLEAWTMAVALNWSRSQLRRRGSECRATARLAGRVLRRGRGSPVEETLDDRWVPDGTEAARVHGSVRNALFHARSTLAEDLMALAPDVMEHPETQEAGHDR